MKERVEIRTDRYAHISYRQFEPTPWLHRTMRLVGLILAPLVWPLVLLAKLAPETGFRTASELLSRAPFAWGVLLRYHFYRWTLRRCGENVFIGFGTVFYYPDVGIGSNVLIGMYNTVHHCDFGSDVMTADGCCFLSGSRYHLFDRTDIPMSRQGGELKRIRVGDDVWIGANSVVMDDVGSGCVVGAGSVVSKPVDPLHVVAGNPARTLKVRGQQRDS